MFPELLYDPEAARPGSQAILHAKCAVVDGRYARVTSANFTSAGQRRNLEVGVLIDDRAFAMRLESQWQALVAAGLLSKIG